MSYTKLKESRLDRIAKFRKEWNESVGVAMNDLPSSSDVQLRKDFIEAVNKDKNYVYVEEK